MGREDCLALRLRSRVDWLKFVPRLILTSNISLRSLVSIRADNEIPNKTRHGHHTGEMNPARPRLPIKVHEQTRIYSISYKHVEHSREDGVFTGGGPLSASIASWSPMIYGTVVLRVDSIIRIFPGCQCPFSLPPSSKA